MRSPSKATTLAAFARARWGRRFADREALLWVQERRLARFLRQTLPRAPFYRLWAGHPFSELPIVDKKTVLADFAAFNTRGVGLDAALGVALDAERSRDFRPTIGDLTVGLSSGTSGTRGIFLVSARERAAWAGRILARLLSPKALRRLLAPWSPPLLVAFFLRANSNLYESVGSRRLRFDFHDLLEPLDRHQDRLNREPPDLLVAPPTVLRRLAEAALEGTLRIAPLQVVSVAEVLEADDERAIRAAFGVPVQQVYQATEGFLGVSCEEGRVHLNEEDLRIEADWLDREHRRFRPIVTDFSRTTQLVVRYRLDDILQLAEGPCPCGRPSQSLAAIEGRADEILWARDATGGLAPVFPDLVRRAFALADPEGALRDYRVEQVEEEWRVRLDLGAATDEARGAIEGRVGAEVGELARRVGLRMPELRFGPWRDEPLHEKRRRIRCLRRPS